MFDTPSSLPEKDRKGVVAALGKVLKSGLALQLLLYFAHWNVKGMTFAALHPFLGELADKVDGFNDRVAERIVILGGLAKVEIETLSHNNTVGDRALIKVVARGVKDYLEDLREARDAVGAEDKDTEQILIDGVLDWEKYGWQLLASIEETA